MLLTRRLSRGWEIVFAFILLAFRAIRFRANIERSVTACIVSLREVSSILPVGHSPKGDS